MNHAILWQPSYYQKQVIDGGSLTLEGLIPNLRASTISVITFLGCDLGQIPHKHNIKVLLNYTIHWTGDIDVSAHCFKSHIIPTQRTVFMLCKGIMYVEKTLTFLLGECSQIDK